MDNRDFKNQRTEQERAVALEYSSLEELPRVLAAGVGEAAREIIALAREHSIPLQQNKELTRLLQTARPGATIDSRTFRLVAEVITFLYATDQEWQAEHAFLDPVLTSDETIR